METKHLQFSSQTHHNPPTRERVIVFGYYPGFFAIVREPVPPPETDHPKDSTFPCTLI